VGDVMSIWWCEQRQLWQQTWLLCKQRFVVLVCWWLAVVVLVSLVLMLWQLLVAQLHISGLALPAMVWRVIFVLVLSEYAMTVLTLMVGKPQQEAMDIEHCLCKVSALFGYVLLLRCLMLVVIAVGAVLLVWPALLVAVFASFVMTDILLHDVKGVFAIQRVMQLWRGHGWQIIRMCAAWYAWVGILAGLTVALYVKHAPANGVVAVLMLLLVSVMLMRCMQAVAVSQVNRSLVVLAADNEDEWVEQMG
jgi:hypothetical protein